MRDTIKFLKTIGEFLLKLCFTSMFHILCYLFDEGKYGLCHCSSFSRVFISVLIFWACSVSSGCCIVLLYVLFRFRSLVSCKHLCSLSDSIGHHLFRFSRNHDGSIAHNSKFDVHQLLRIPFPSNTDAGSLRILLPSFIVIRSLT